MMNNLLNLSLLPAKNGKCLVFFIIFRYTYTEIIFYVYHKEV